MFLNVLYGTVFKFLNTEKNKISSTKIGIMIVITDALDSYLKQPWL